jgi:hypothetical protein
MERPTRTATIPAQISAKSSVWDDMGRVRMWDMVCMMLFLRICRLDSLACVVAG